MVKAMLATGRFNDQDIQSYFTRPSRTLNHRVFSEIRNEQRHAHIHAASEEELDDFLLGWPHIDAETGLRHEDDELVIKAREAMVAAVQIFNSAGLTFRSELFIVSAMIAWTYVLHAWFKREGIDYAYRDQTTYGAPKYWDLNRCLREDSCPLDDPEKDNILFLLDIRHEIEHRSTSRIDDALSGYLQSCCLNFNSFLKEQFGKQLGLERRLPLALQFITFSAEHRSRLKRAMNVPDNVAGAIANFEDGLSAEQLSDPKYRLKIAYVPIVGNRARGADQAVQFVSPDSAEAERVSNVLLKPVQKERYLASKIVEIVQGEGYPRFRMHNHTQLWKNLDARNADKNYGQVGDYRGSFVWYDSWLKRVLAHCEENAEDYR